MIENTLTVTDISCSYNSTELFQPVSFTLCPNEIMHLQGPNGIGKTTLLRCLAGFVRPLAGQISMPWVMQGDDDNARLLFLGHKNAVCLSLSVSENLLWSPIFRFSPSPTQIQNALIKMGLDQFKNELASSLSAGQKQRLALARLCLIKTQLWILDEPFTSLDKEGCQLIQEVMQRHLEEGGMIILTTHQLLTHTFPACKTLELISSER